jgi:hypothetical protein
MEFAKKYHDKWYILSAKYGVLQPSDQCESYDNTLNNMNKTERSKWSRMVLDALATKISSGDTITIIAGKKYYEYLEPALKEKGIEVNIPLRCMGFGKQLQWLNSHLLNTNHNRADDLNHFYYLLDRLRKGLGGARVLGDCNGRMQWPERGVYFFFEPEEFRSSDPQIPRVVRVGTHAVSKNSQSTLWGRLITHRGTSNGLGNHRGSIFRLHVGAAMIAKSNGAINLPTWGKGQDAPKEIREKESFLEREVSKYINRMSILWLSINDEPGPKSDRAYIERNVIGLLSGLENPIDLASSKWLGNWSPHPSIQKSGIWNVEHVSFEYEPEFLVMLSNYIDAMLERA